MTEARASLGPSEPLSGDPFPPLQGGRRVIHQTHLWTVALDHLSSGQYTAPDYLVIESRVEWKQQATGIAVVPVVGDRIGLLRIHRHAVNRCMWEIPMGFMDADEVPLAAALRELQEETAIAAKASAMMDLGFVTPVPSTLRARIQLFAARAGHSIAIPHGEIGLGPLHLVSRAEAKSMVLDGTIEEPTTAVAIFRYLNRTGW